MTVTPSTVRIRRLAWAGVGILLVFATSCGDGGELTSPPELSTSDPSCAGVVFSESSTRDDPAHPLTVTVCLETAQVKVGQPAIFRVIASDGDAPIIPFGQCGSEVSFGDPRSPLGFCDPVCLAEDGEPPTPEPGTLNERLEYVYQAAGEYAATLQLTSGNVCQTITGGALTIRIPIAVAEA